MVKEDDVILVDSEDCEIGVMGKMEAHQKGLLHRAFSVFVFNSRGELIVQQRAFSKYHSGGLWTNTCCSHPRAGETVMQAALRRLNEEMGMFCELETKFSFVYNAALDNNLIEHEFDYVLFGRSDLTPEINSIEVNDWKYLGMEALKVDIHKHPEKYTEWLKNCFDKVFEHYTTHVKF